MCFVCFVCLLSWCYVVVVAVCFSVLRDSVCLYFVGLCLSGCVLRFDCLCLNVCFVVDVLLCLCFVVMLCLSFL